MELFLIDAIGPFFRGYRRKRINWSKSTVAHLESGTPAERALLRDELRRFADGAAAQGYNAVTLDDLTHLAPHPLHDPEVAERIARLREEFNGHFDLLRGGCGMKIFLTSDVLPVTPAIERALGDDRDAFDDYYRQLVAGILDDFPQLSGLVLRLGECDGHDVRDPLRSRLHLRDHRHANRLLRLLLPEFERRGRELILRTWTVGAYPIGDLIWHRDTLARTLDGLDSPRLIVSMKHGESDFFRYLPLNSAFHRIRQRKLIEFQARREYEGAGEFPSFIGWDCERFAEQLAGVEHMAGISIWCQTGGWHRFRRRAFLENDGSDIWIRLNTRAATAVFRDSLPAAAAVAGIVGESRAAAACELLRLTEKVILDLYYIDEFARQKWFFRRVRVPPLVHVFWDSLFINAGVRAAMRRFVSRPAEAIRTGEEAMECFEKIIALARESGLPEDDLLHFRDFCQLLLLARSYYLLPDGERLLDRLREAKRDYKRRWPSESRRRYRIRISEKPLPAGPAALAIATRLLLRARRGYRLLDHLLLLRFAPFAYRVFRRRAPKALPKFLRKSAMGVDVLFK